MYNRVARTLVAYEFLWYKAWVQSIDQAKTGLQATLIIRHPDDGKLYVYFDHEILQLIREAKCLDRMGIEIPENAKIAIFQEEKLKVFYTELHWALTEYDRIVSEVIPVTAVILRPHFNDPPRNDYSNLDINEHRWLHQSYSFWAKTAERASGKYQ